MEPIKIEATFSTPKIWFDEITNNLYITGTSSPENAKEFYTPVMDWFNVLNQITTKINITVIFDLKYFNSSSFRYIKDILIVIANLQKSYLGIVVVWNYYSEDSDMLEDAMLLSEITGATISYNPIDADSHKMDLNSLLRKIVKGKLKR
jgi:hypothetical protein